MGYTLFTNLSGRYDHSDTQNQKEQSIPFKQNKVLYQHKPSWTSFRLRCHPVEATRSITKGHLPRRKDPSADARPPRGGGECSPTARGCGDNHAGWTEEEEDAHAAASAREKTQGKMLSVCMCSNAIRWPKRRGWGGWGGGVGAIKAWSATACCINERVSARPIANEPTFGPFWALDFFVPPSGRV
jgi:hypothetical protein